jgi:hypothetical protein
VTEITVAPAINPVLAEKATAIHGLIKRTRESIVEIGQHLFEAHDQVDHGEWRAWIKTEFDWSDQTARRFIHVFELSRDDKLNTVLNLDLPLGVLYQLAAPKAEAARTEIAEHIEAGETVTKETVIAAVTGRRRSPAKTDSTEAASAVDSTERRKAQNATLFNEEPSELGAGAAGPEHRRHEDSGDDHHHHDDDDDDDDGDDDGDDDDRDHHNADDHHGDVGEAAAAAPVARAPKKKPSLAESWESTPEERQVIGELVLEEFFARADGADILDRIPAARRKEVVQAFLDQLAVEGMLGAMSLEFGQELRARLPAKRKRKNINLIANSAHQRGDYSRH